MERRSNYMPTNYQIFEYWKDRQIGKEWVLLDYGEPQCWGCGASVVVETDKDLVDGNYRAIWKRTSGILQRCHIIPKALGGTSEPDNLFLMCESCHHESPDTTCKEGFFAWVLLKRSRCIYGRDASKFMDDLNGLCAIRGTDIINIYKFLSTKHIPTFILKLYDGTNGHAGRFSDFNIPIRIMQEFDKEAV